MSVITVELKSDLCAGTGTGFSSFVDTDISYDRYGIPYLPGRRLKGCLREAAEYYYGKDCTEIARVFGTAGGQEDALQISSGQMGVFKISNGHLTDISHLRHYLDSLPDTLRPNADKVLGLFTHIQASTAINEDTGTTKQESLRFTRALYQRIPEKDSNLTFVFACEDDGDAAAIALLETACKALRNIGSNRTRGLGAVKCVYDSQAKLPAPHAPEKLCGTPVHIPQRIGQKTEGDKALKLHLCLLDPLLITASSDEESKNYVSGTAVLGALASLYLKQYKQVDENFSRLFLRGEVTYSNLYISDQTGTLTVPAPYYIRKLKSSHKELDGKHITFFDDKEAFVAKKMPGRTAEEIHEAARLAQEKPLRGKMVALGEMHAVDVRTERIYHHSVHGVNRGLDGKLEDTSLYTQTCISAGQYLTGVISGPEDLLTILKNLLAHYPLRLGRSRTAQYSRCQAVQGSLTITDPVQPEKQSLKANQKLVIILESDAIPATPEAPLLSLARDIVPDAQESDIDYRHTAADYRVIHGYHVKRNLRNIPVRAVGMGSVITIEMKEAFEAPARYLLVGGRTAEGFGHVRLATEEELIGSLSKDNDKEKDEENKNEDKADATIQVSDEAMIQALNESYQETIGWFIRALAREDISAAQKLANDLYFGNDLYKGLRSSLTGKPSTLSFIGRLTQMVEQATSLEDLNSRFHSIKSKDAESREKKQVIANSLYSAIQNRKDAVWRPCALTILRLAKYDLKKMNGGGGNE